MNHGKWARTKIQMPSTVRNSQRRGRRLSHFTACVVGGLHRMQKGVYLTAPVPAVPADCSDRSDFPCLLPSGNGLGVDVQHCRRLFRCQKLPYPVIVGFFAGVLFVVHSLVLSVLLLAWLRFARWGALEDLVVSGGVLRPRRTGCLEDSAGSPSVPLSTFQVFGGAVFCRGLFRLRSAWCRRMWRRDWPAFCASTVGIRMRLRVRRPPLGVWRIRGSRTRMPDAFPTICASVTHGSITVVGAFHERGVGESSGCVSVPESRFRGQGERWVF